MTDEWIIHWRMRQQLRESEAKRWRAFAAGCLLTGCTMLGLFLFALLWG